MSHSGSWLLNISGFLHGLLWKEKTRGFCIGVSEWWIHTTAGRSWWYYTWGFTDLFFILFDRLLICDHHRHVAWFFIIMGGDGCWYTAVTWLADFCCVLLISSYSLRVYVHFHRTTWSNVVHFVYNISRKKWIKIRLTQFHWSQIR